MQQIPFANSLVDSFIRHLPGRECVSVIAPDASIWDGVYHNERIHILDESGVLRIVVGKPGEEYSELADEHGPGPHHEYQSEDDYYYDYDPDDPDGLG